MKYLFLLSMLLSISCACSKLLFGSEELTLPKQPYTGNELRIDGYYYYKYYPGENEVYYATYFLYENGIILEGDAVNENRIPELENKFKTLEWHNSIKKYKAGWGLFTIDGDKILFEKWYPNSPGQPKVYIREGKILNDTTFHITASYRPDGSKRSEEDEVYHFKPFSPKPDSTNNFVK